MIFVASTAATLLAALRLVVHLLASRLFCRALLQLSGQSTDAALLHWPDFCTL
jgi:hypothetical protein